MSQVSNPIDAASAVPAAPKSPAPAPSRTKTAPKKAVEPTAKKPAPKKAVKAAARAQVKPVGKSAKTAKPVAKKSAPKKPAAKKPVTKTPSIKKPVVKPAAPSAAKPKADPKKLVASPALAPKQKTKLVRDSFTMPQVDFALIDVLKSRSLNMKHPVKKSELLRAGLQALQALDDLRLLVVLEALEPLKAGRPKKD